MAERVRVQVEMGVADAAMLQSLQVSAETPGDTILRLIHGAATIQQLMPGHVRVPSFSREPGYEVITESAPTSNDARTRTPVQEPEEKIEIPVGWPERDPRTVFCLRYRVQPQALATIQEQVGATDAEMLTACRWTVGNYIPTLSVMQRLTRVLQLKVEDRMLMPLANRLNMDLRALRGALVARNVSPQQAMAVFNDSPSVVTIEGIVEEAQK